MEKHSSHIVSDCRTPLKRKTQNLSAPIILPAVARTGTTISGL